MKVDDYLAHYGDTPWSRTTPSIRAFVLGEVERQRWRIGTPDYKKRVEWMTDAWLWAQERSKQGAWHMHLAPNPLGDASHSHPTVEDILFIAARVEPHENKYGFRRVGVQVGDRTCPSPNEVPGAVNRLWEFLPEVVPVQGRDEIFNPMTADDFYYEFELIHPFGDGNGRTGKILHNWLLGTLDDPVLVADYFGGGNP